MQVLVSDNRNQMAADAGQEIDLSQQVQKSGKKVSIATLKRRQKELEDKKKMESEAAQQRDKSQPGKSRERKPLFSRK